MRILFVANTVSNLYKDIENEMIREGHDVLTIRDCVIKYDPASKVGLNVPIVKNLLWKKRSSEYWKEVYRNYPEIDKPFDLLFALSGTSVTEKMVAHLKINNPRIRTVLYTWDGCDYYDFRRHFRYMDKCYTFDLLDSKKDNKWKLLPIFYCLPNLEDYNDNVEYDLFSVGSNHGGRYSFIKRLLPQLHDVSFYIKIVSPFKTNGIKERLYYLFSSPSKKQVRKEEVAFSQEKENKDLLLRKGLSTNDYMKKMLSSRCVLDDQREGQSGLTARFIWALALKKKIITTNKWALDYDFVSSKQVVVISKKNPILPIEFLKSEIEEDDISNVSNLCITNWLREIIK